MDRMSVIFGFPHRSGPCRPSILVLETSEGGAVASKSWREGTNVFIYARPRSQHHKCFSNVVPGHTLFFLIQHGTSSRKLRLSIPGRDLSSHPTNSLFFSIRPELVHGMVGYVFLGRPRVGINARDGGCKECIYVCYHSPDNHDML